MGQREREGRQRGHCTAEEGRLGMAQEGHAPSHPPEGSGMGEGWWSAAVRAGSGGAHPRARARAATGAAMGWSCEPPAAGGGARTHTREGGGRGDEGGAAV